MRAVYRVANEDDILLDADAIKLRELWKSYCSEDGIPRMSLLDQGALEWCRDQIEIMVPMLGGAFHFAHHGKNIAAVAGRALTGKDTKQFTPEGRKFFSELNIFAGESKRPVFCYNQSALVTPVHAWQRHHFPFYKDDGALAYLVNLVKPVLMRHEIWQSVSQIAGFGAGSLEAMLDDSGKIYDFVILEAAGMSQIVKNGSLVTLNQLLGRQLDQETLTSLTNGKVGETLFSETLIHDTGEDRKHIHVEILASELCLILNLRDVTDVHKAQSMLEKRTEELRLAQQLGRIGSWRMKLNATTVWWSQEMYELLRLKPGVFVPTTKAIWELYLDDGAKRAGEVQQTALRTGQTRSIDVSSKRGDGTTGHFTIETSLERDASGAVVGFFGTIQDITIRKEAELNLERLAYFDPLTSLPNRAMFKKELDHKIQSSMTTKHPFYLMLMDLDKFKDVNDSLGHSAGDALLERVARGLREIAPSQSLVARLGGDEFAILFQQIDGGPTIDDFATAVVMCCHEPFQLDQGEVQIGISIGISEGLKDGIDGNALLKNADLALYSAKDGGRGRYHFYKNVMSTMADDRMSLSRDLKIAMTENKLELHYQPLVAMGSKKVIGFEALLRWNHPERGYIPPSEFIPIAESSSLICDLGFWAMTNACKTLKQWIDAGNPPLSMAVNVSAVQFWQSTFEVEVKTILAETGIDPTLLTLEVTESVFLDKGNSRVRTCFDELAKIGVNLAIDDFGTGFSSLGYLSELPFKKLKIDRSFVTHVDKLPEKQKLLQGIVGLARGLGMTTVVEGAETMGEILILQSLGCNIVQGFFYSKPQPFENWANMIEQVEGMSETDIQTTPATETMRYIA
jgi:diguanylate cyclase (GGDEF)-like protein